MKEQGGFKTGERVEVRFGNSWKGDFLIIDFTLLKVQITAPLKETLPYWAKEPIWVSIFEIRKPNIKVGRHG